MEHNNTFVYTYSAAQSKEVLAIRNKYLPREESKLEELKRFDRKVQKAGMVQSLSIGILGALVFGLGMCLSLQVIGSSVFLGALLGLWGVVAMITAYPVHHFIFKKEKEKYTPRILELAAELCGEKE